MTTYHSYAEYGDDHPGNEIDSAELIDALNRVKTRTRARIAQGALPKGSPERERLEGRVDALSYMLNRCTAHRLGIRRLSAD